MPLLNKGDQPKVVQPAKGVDVASIFANIKNAKARVDANYERAGRYYTRINSIKMIETRKNGEAMVIEQTVIAVLDNDNGLGHKEGDQISHLMLVKNDSFLGNVKAILGGICGQDPELVSSEDALAVCSDKQPLAGLVVEKLNRTIQTKAGKDFTVINYVREVPPKELLTSLDPKTIKAFWPNGELEKAGK
jgi:hypothetical protein